MNALVDLFLPQSEKVWELKDLHTYTKQKHIFAQATPTRNNNRCKFYASTRISLSKLSYRQHKLPFPGFLTSTIAILCKMTFCSCALSPLTGRPATEDWRCMAGTCCLVALMVSRSFSRSPLALLYMWFSWAVASDDCKPWVSLISIVKWPSSQMSWSYSTNHKPLE